MLLLYLNSINLYKPYSIDYHSPSSNDFLIFMMDINKYKGRALSSLDLHVKEIWKQSLEFRK